MSVVPHSLVCALTITTALGACGSDRDPFAPGTSDWPLGLTGKLAFFQRGGSSIILYVRAGLSESPQPIYALRADRFCCNSHGTLAWAPSGRALAFDVGYDAGLDVGEAVWLLTANGQVQVDSSRARWGNSPTYAPDGRLAWVWQRLCESNCGIYVDAQFIADCVCDGPMSWFPDGQSLAIAGIRRLALADGVETPISSPGKHPAVSPEGDRIAFVVERVPGRQAELWVVQADGSGRRQLTSAHFDVRPTWSPDGSVLIFQRDETMIVAVPAAGGDVTPLQHAAAHTLLAAHAWSAR